MKPVLNKYFISAAVIYLTLLVIKHTGTSFDSFIMYYLADLLCLPIVLSICFAVLNFTHQLEKLSVSMIVVAWAAFSLLFEVILPKYSVVYTKDYLDIVCYGLGGIGFYFHQKHLVNIPVNKTIE